MCFEPQKYTHTLSRPDSHCLPDSVVPFGTDFWYMKRFVTWQPATGVSQHHGKGNFQKRKAAWMLRPLERKAAESSLASRHHTPHPLNIIIIIRRPRTTTHPPQPTRNSSERRLPRRSSWRRRRHGGRSGILDVADEPLTRAAVRHPTTAECCKPVHQKNRLTLAQRTSLANNAAPKWELGCLAAWTRPNKMKCKRS